MPQQVKYPDDLMMRAKARAHLENLKKNSKYLFYTPNGKLEEFIKIIGEDKHFINLLIAANGIGKTAGMSNIIANLVFKEKNLDWFNYPLFTNFPYLKTGRIVSDPTTISQTIIPELHKWFPKGKYTTGKEGKNYEYKWKTDAGFEFDIMSTEQEPKEFESKTLGFALFDEPPPEAIFKATISRMRLGGIIIVVFTPLSGSAYFYDSFVTHKDTITY